MNPESTASVIKMTEEEWKAWEIGIGRAGAMANAAPKLSLEARIDWLEADVSAQRAAILRLERAFDAVSYAMGTFGFCFLVLVLALAVRT